VPVVAVLPLLDASGDPGNEALGLGLADVLVATLSRLPAAHVLSRAAAAGYHDRSRSPVRIARELGADFVVDGVLQRSADDLRVTLSLVQSTTGLVVWSDVYDGPLRDVFALQRSAAEAVAGALSLRLTPEDLSRIRRGPAIAAGAFADYARARELFEQADVPGNLEGAVALFEKALARDPTFALAAAGLGEAQWGLYKRTHDPAYADRASAATRDALRLDPEQPLVWIALATIEAGTGRLAEAEQELRRAIAQQPDNDEAYEALGRVLSDRGQRDQALKALERAAELRPNYWRHIDALGLAHYDAGRYKEAIAAFTRVTVLRPQSARALNQLGTAQAMNGDRKSALASYQRAIALEPDADTLSNAGAILYSEGRIAEAADAFARAVALQPEEPISHRNLGDAKGRLGRGEEARGAYRRAVELTEAQLRINPKDARNLGRLAVYHAKLGERAEARDAAEKALALAPGAPDVLFYAAVARALGGQRAEAIALLESALKAGYSPELVRTDEDLAALRGTKEFERLMSSRGATQEGGRK
jgi:tetratricopeptide (TPR) repeat protein